MEITPGRCTHHPRALPTLGLPSVEAYSSADRENLQSNLHRMLQCQLTAVGGCSWDMLQACTHSLRQSKMRLFAKWCILGTLVETAAARVGHGHPSFTVEAVTVGETLCGDYSAALGCKSFFGIWEVQRQQAQSGKDAA